MRDTVTGVCLCTPPKIPRSLRAQNRLSGQEHWQCVRCLQLWRLAMPANLRFQDPKWVRAGKNMARLSAKHRLAEQLAAHTQAEIDAWQRKAPLVAARKARERASRARRYRLGVATTPAQRVAYKARYGVWRAWLKPTVGDMLAERQRVIRSEDSARRAAPDTVGSAGAPGADDTRGKIMVRKIVKATFVASGATMVLAIGMGGLAVSGVLPEGPKGVAGSGTVSTPDETSLSDAWFELSKTERKAACKNPYGYAVSLGAVSGQTVGTSLQFLRLICN